MNQSVSDTLFFIFKFSVKWAAFIIILGLVFLALGCSSHKGRCQPLLPDYKPDDTFSVATYNIKGLPLRELKYDEMTQPLGEYDVVLIQELFSEYWHFSCHMPHRYYSEEKDGVWYGDGLARYSRVPFSHYERKKWDACNTVNGMDCIAPKGYSRAIHKFGEIEVLIYNLHMDSGKKSKDHIARVSQNMQLLYEIRSENIDIPVIIVGDFNEKVSLFDVQGFNDVCDNVDMCVSQEIDRVLYRSSSKVRIFPIWWEKRVDFRGKNDVPYSDHFPIGVNFMWRYK